MNSDTYATAIAALEHRRQLCMDEMAHPFITNAVHMTLSITVANVNAAIADLTATQQRIQELEAQLVSVSRELVSTDNADRYMRGFNDGYDHASQQAQASEWTPIDEPFDYFDSSVGLVAQLTATEIRAEVYGDSIKIDFGDDEPLIRLCKRVDAPQAEKDVDDEG